jgi:hypothetical protein
MSLMSKILGVSIMTLGSFNLGQYVELSSVLEERMEPVPLNDCLIMATTHEDLPMYKRLLWYGQYQVIVDYLQETYPSSRP